MLSWVIFNLTDTTVNESRVFSPFNLSIHADHSFFLFVCVCAIILVQF